MLPSIVGLINGVSAPVSTNSYESIATVTVGVGGSSTVSFTSISSGYSHLQLRFFNKSAYSSGTDTSMWFRLNGDSTSSSYADHSIGANGATVYTGNDYSQNLSYVGDTIGSGSATNIFGAGIVDILDYTNVNKNKVLRCLSGWDANGSGYISETSGLWNNGAAITTITIGVASGWAQNSTFALYGVK
jgi:hypothetical protein